jgi:carboxyl-terminal processing protease
MKNSAPLKNLYLCAFICFVGVASASTKTDSVPVDEIQQFVKVFQTISNHYVEARSNKDIMQAGLRGLLVELDPHSSYLSAEQAQGFDELRDGGYAGIGIESDESNPHQIRVVAPFDDTPAARAGLRAGDYIVAINGIAVDNNSANANPNQLRGKPGTSVVLRVIRPGADKPITLTIVREIIAVQSVKAKWLEAGFAYFRISAFQGDTAIEFRKQWQRLQTEANGVKTKGIILDVRSNPGGLVQAAIDIADEFLGEALVVSLKGRYGTSQSKHFSKAGEQFSGVPVVLLIDAGSASASEILAGALQDHHRATLMGSRSFGKGSVQNVFALGNGDAIKLTTARYYTPSDRSIQAQGIVPDILLQGNGKVDYTESDLPNHIQANNTKPDSVNAEAGIVLQGDTYIEKALAHLKQLKQRK